MTIRQLLTHTSGIDCGDDFTDTGEDDDCLERYVAEVLPEVGLLHEPGALRSYCNGGYTILGRLVEVLDGRPFDDALTERIFEPLGLEATTTARLEPGRRVTPGHRFDPKVGALVPEQGRMPRSAGPAGNVVATAMDLAVFCEVLFSGRSELLDQELVQEMIRPQVTFRDGGQGLAWVIRAPNVAVHGGSTRGSTAFLAAIPGVGSMSIRRQRARSRRDRRRNPGLPLRHAESARAGPGYRRARRARQPVSVATSADTPASTSPSTATRLWPPRASPVPPPSCSRTPNRSPSNHTVVVDSSSSRPYEDGFGVWDFDDLNADGAPHRLLSSSSRLLMSKDVERLTPAQRGALDRSRACRGGHDLNRTRGR